MTSRNNKHHNLTIIIVTYNSANVIHYCLSKINFNKYKVIIVDNASIDNSCALIEKNFPTAQLIKLKQNIGYGRANNIALKKVETEFAVILNPDANIEEASIEVILKQMKENNDIAIAGPVISKNSPPKPKELAVKISRIKQDFASKKDNVGNNENLLFVKFVVGAIFFMRMSIFHKIGFFDQNIFLYYEDNELCKRVIDNGYKNVIVLNSVGFHIGGKSSAGNSRETSRKNWHLTWSKLYWKKISKSFFRAKISAIKLSFIYLYKTIFCLLMLNQKKAAVNFNVCSSSFSFFIGLKAFKNNQEPRG